MNRSKGSLLIIVALIVLLLSCSDGVILDEFHDVDLWDWDTEDTVVFDFPKIIGDGEIDVSIGVRSTETYEYDKVYLTGSLECDDVLVRLDSIAVDIYNSEGIPNGQGFPYMTTTAGLPKVHVDSGHQYTYKVAHIMSPGKLKGICGIGLELKSE